jgi:hypothetical protein
MQSLPDTAFVRAALHLLEQVGSTFTRPVTMILAGGAAVHMYTPHARMSGDLDAEFQGRVLLPSDLLVSYTDDDGTPRTLSLDSNYNTTLGLMHEDYVQDSVDLGEHANGMIRLRMLSALDLAVSKISRLADNDREDIRLLAENGFITSADLRRRALEALEYYVGYPQSVRLNIADAVAIVQEVEHDRGAQHPACR